MALPLPSHPPDRLRFPIDGLCFHGSQFSKQPEVSQQQTNHWVGDALVKPGINMHAALRVAADKAVEAVEPAQGVTALKDLTDESRAAATQQGYKLIAEVTALVMIFACSGTDQFWVGMFSHWAGP